MKIENTIFKELDPSCEISITPISPQDPSEPQNKSTGLALVTDTEHESGSHLQVEFKFPDNPVTYRALVKVAHTEPLESGSKFRVNAFICDLKKTDNGKSSEKELQST